MTKRDFLGEEFYKYCVQQYESSRHYLKNCGKPVDEVDRFMINYHKETALIFGKIAGVKGEK